MTRPMPHQVPVISIQFLPAPQGVTPIFLLHLSLNIDQSGA
jgi:hypothetical protein